MQAQKSKNTKDPWAAIDAIVLANKEPMGEEWFTIDQYRARYGGSREGTASKLNRDLRFEKWRGFCKATQRITRKYRIKP